MTYEEIKNGMRQAAELMEQARHMTRTAIELNCRDLRGLNLSSSTLCELKRQLNKFDMTTRRWK